MKRAVRVQNVLISVRERAILHLNFKAISDVYILCERLSSSPSYTVEMFGVLPRVLPLAFLVNAYNGPG